MLIAEPSLGTPALDETSLKHLIQPYQCIPVHQGSLQYHWEDCLPFLATLQNPCRVLCTNKISLVVVTKQSLQRELKRESLNRARMPPSGRKQYHLATRMAWKIDWCVGLALKAMRCTRELSAMTGRALWTLVRHHSYRASCTVGMTYHKEMPGNCSGSTI